DPSAHPERRRYLRREGRRPDVALGRAATDHARAAVELLLRPGDAEAQGVLRPRPRPVVRPPMTDYREADFSRLKTVPIAQRPNKVDPSLLAHPPGGDRSFAAFWDSLPDVLAAKDARDVARLVAGAPGPR